jgi:ATP-dependent protease ClpP protease subunit
MPTSQPNAPEDTYGVFCDDINSGSAGRIVVGVSTAQGGGTKRLHLMFQSWGGFVGDGVMLYNYFRAQSGLEIALYNSGQVASAAVTAYLGAKRRITSKSALFMLHKAQNTQQSAPASRLERVAKNLLLDDARIEAIYRQHIKMPDKLWEEWQYHDVYLTGEEAVDYGIATEIGEFAPPAGFMIYRV